jgi:hypothetical protein
MLSRNPLRIVDPLLDQRCLLALRFALSVTGDVWLSSLWGMANSFV